jgi:hypothetical protein
MVKEMLAWTPGRSGFDRQNKEMNFQRQLIVGRLERLTISI